MIVRPTLAELSQLICNNIKVRFSKQISVLDKEKHKITAMLLPN